MNRILTINLYQKKIRVQEMKTYQLFVVPIGNEKITEKYGFAQKHQC